MSSFLILSRMAEAFAESVADEKASGGKVFALLMI
jgi:hypothetical protein